MSDDHGRFIWYELMTSEPAAAKLFYGFVVGWSFRDMPMGDDTYTVFEADGQGVAGVFLLDEEHKSRGVPPNWTGYVYVDDCDAAAEKVKSLGGQVLRPPSDIPGVGRFAIITDPHGALIAIMKPVPPSEDRPRAARGTPGHGGWHELYAGDAAADFAFYRELFGWTETRQHDMGPMGVYHLFGNADGEIGGIMTKPDQVPAPCWGYYFETKDVDAAADRMTRGHGRIMMGPMDVPGGSRVVTAADPQGAAFALVTSKF